MTPDDQPTLDDGRIVRCARIRWLGRPFFFVAVATLVLNDRFLKAAEPNWWTGKLSDVAGVAVAATIAAAFLGRRIGVSVVAVAFTLLKTTPGVAELAAPLLGGITRRDPSDIIALAILIPLQRLLADPPVTTRPSRLTIGHGHTARIGARVQAACGVALPLVGGVLAVGATTATSCGPTPAVTQVAARGDAFYALIDNGWKDPDWARSVDGGRTWVASEAPEGASTFRVTEDVFTDPGPSGPLKACTPEKSCWQLHDRRSIERTSPTGRPVTEVHLSETEFESISTGCAGGHIGVLGSIAATSPPKGPRVVASYGAAGVLVRTPNGTWVARRVLDAPPIEANAAAAFASRWVLLFFGPLTALGLMFGRRRLPSFTHGLAVVAAGWVTTIMACGAVVVLAGSGTDPDRITGPVAVLGWVITTIAAVDVARRPRRHNPFAGLPPPPLGEV